MGAVEGVLISFGSSGPVTHEEVHLLMKALLCIQAFLA